MATFTVTVRDAHTRQVIDDPRELDAHDTISVAICDEDGSPVSFVTCGTSEHARCACGHRWEAIHAAGDNDGGWLAR